MSAFADTFDAVRAGAGVVLARVRLAKARLMVWVHTGRMPR